MRVVCAYFDTDKTDGFYTRCARVWECSARKNSGADAVDLIELEPVKGKDPFLFNANHAKLLVWRDYIREHDDEIILMDADTLIMGNLWEAFRKYDFDVAITIRDHQTRFMMNGGVVFVRNTERAQEIIDEWYESDCTLQEDKVLHEKFRRTCGGMNQSAFGHLKGKKLSGKVAEIPCSRYNQVEWNRGCNEKPLVIHVKTHLRNAIFSGQPIDALISTLRPSAKAWRDMEVEMLQEASIKEVIKELIIDKTPLQIIGIEFAADGACNYKRLAEVWKYSAQKAHPWANVRIVQLSPPARKLSHYARNHYKLRAWNDIIQKVEYNTILMDMDMAIFRPIDDVFDMDFDVCYTRRTQTRMPLNGGVLFVKPTEAARNFFNKWQDVDFQLLQKRNMYMDYIHKYCGQNQASFGWMLENANSETAITSVECTFYNCCNEEWAAINDETRVVHYKSALKRICSKSGDYRKSSPEHKIAIDKWLALEKEMLKNTSIKDRLTPQELPVDPFLIIDPVKETPKRKDKKSGYRKAKKRGRFKK